MHQKNTVFLEKANRIGHDILSATLSPLKAVLASLEQKFYQHLDPFIDKPIVNGLKMTSSSVLMCAIFAIVTCLVTWFLHFSFGISFFDALQSIINFLLACWHRLAGFFTSLWATLLAYKMFIGYLTSCIAFLLGFAINSSRVMFISTQLIRFFTSTLMVQMLIEVCVKGMLGLGVNGDWLFDLPLTNTYPYGSLISFFLLWAGTNCLTLYTLKRKRSGNADYLKVDDKN